MMGITTISLHDRHSLLSLSDSPDFPLDHLVQPLLFLYRGVHCPQKALLFVMGQVSRIWELASKMLVDYQQRKCPLSCVG